MLAVSTIEPKKNFDSLIRWFDYWKATGIPHQLAIIGKWGWKCAAVRKAIATARYRSDILMPGYVSQSEMPAVMAAADLLLMPSRYEGFGLPALEAMAVGTPAVVSDQGALPETVGNAGLVLPLDDVIWQAEIPTLLRHSERLQAMRTAGLQWSRTRSWEHTGERLLQVLEDAHAQRQPNPYARIS